MLARVGNCSLACLGQHCEYAGLQIVDILHIELAGEVIAHERRTLLVGIQQERLESNLELDLRQNGCGWILRPPELVDEVRSL